MFSDCFSLSLSLSHPINSRGGLALTGRGEFRYPGGLAYWDGCLFVSDSNHSVQMFDAANGQFLRAFGSRGDAPGRFNTPFYMTGMLSLSPFSAFREYHIYFAFFLLCFISLSFSICFSLSHSILHSLSLSFFLSFLAVWSNRLYIGEYFNHRVQVYDLRTFQVWTSAEMGHNHARPH